MEYIFLAGTVILLGLMLAIDRDLIDIKRIL